MKNKTNAEHFPWLDNRKDPDAKPTYKIIARCMSLTGDSIVMLHKAGGDHVVNYYIRDLVTNDSIMAALEKNEADLLRWVVNSEITDPLTN
jgi:hypothetical protein